MRGIFADKALTTLLCVLAVHVGVEAYEVDALYFLHFAYTYLLTRKSYVKGSSQYLSDTLAASFRQRGGTLLCGQRVLGIDTDGRAVQRVRTRQHRLAARRIVFTGCPNQVLDLLPPNEALAAYEAKLATLQFARGLFTVYIGLSRPAAEIGLTDFEYMIVAENYLDQAGTEASDALPETRTMLSICNYAALDAAYGNTLQINILEPGSAWLDLPRPTYREKKRRLAQDLIDAACRHFPQLRGAIRYIDASTPHTNQKYTLAGGGSSFAYKFVPGHNPAFLAKPPVEGLEFVGTWVNGPGYEPAMCLGFTAATLYQRKLARHAGAGMGA